MPGGAAGLQNQSGGRKVPGGFDSLPSPPQSQRTVTSIRGLPANRVFRGAKIFSYNGRKNLWDPLPGKRVGRGEYDSSINDYSFRFWPVKIGCGLPTRSGRCPRKAGFNKA